MARQAVAHPRDGPQSERWSRRQLTAAGTSWVAVRTTGGRGVRIPSSVMEAAHVRLDQQVDVREERGRIIIEPVRATTFDLATLVAGITDENRHAEIESGGPVGNEIL